MLDTSRLFACILLIFSVNAYSAPEFDSNTGILRVPIVRVDGKLYRNAEVMLRGDGTWSLQAIDSPIAATNPICGIPRATARNDALQELTETYSPSFSLIESLLESDMDAYDAICAMTETSVLLEILNRLSESYYPHFSLIKTLTDSDLQAYNKLQD